MWPRARPAWLMTAGLAAVVLVACTTSPAITRSSPATAVQSTVSPPPSATRAVSTSALLDSTPATPSAKVTGPAAAGAPTLTTATSAPPSKDEVRLTRPLHLPVLHPGQTCPVSPETTIDTSDFGGVAPGAGPVRPLASSDLISNTNRPGWLAIKSLWFSEPRYQGPFLVRIRRLDGPGPAGLLEDPAVTSFFVPAGPTFNSFSDGYRTVTGATWVKTPGCIAWQVDGLTFSNVIVIQLRCRPPYCTLQRPRTTVSTVQPTAPTSH